MFRINSYDCQRCFSADSTLYPNPLEIVTYIFETFFTLVENTRVDEPKKESRRSKVYRGFKAKQ